MSRIRTAVYPARPCVWCRTLTRHRHRATLTVVCCKCDSALTTQAAYIRRRFRAERAGQGVLVP